jgi:hypothetical protein
MSWHGDPYRRGSHSAAGGCLARATGEMVEEAARRQGVVLGTEVFIPESNFMIQTIISKTEAARRIGITPEAISYFQRTGRLPINRLDGRQVFSVAVIDRFIAERGAGFKRTGRKRKQT